MQKRTPRTALACFASCNKLCHLPPSPDCWSPPWTERAPPFSAEQLSNCMVPPVVHFNALGTAPCSESTWLDTHTEWIVQKRNDATTEITNLQRQKPYETTGTIAEELWDLTARNLHPHRLHHQPILHGSFGIEQNHPHEDLLRHKQHLKSPENIETLRKCGRKHCQKPIQNLWSGAFMWVFLMRLRPPSKKQVTFAPQEVNLSENGEPRNLMVKRSSPSPSPPSSSSSSPSS